MTNSALVQILQKHKPLKSIIIFFSQTFYCHVTEEKESLFCLKKHDEG